MSKKKQTLEEIQADIDAKLAAGAARLAVLKSLGSNQATQAKIQDILDGNIDSLKNIAKPQGLLLEQNDPVLNYLNNLQENLKEIAFDTAISTGDERVILKQNLPSSSLGTNENANRKSVDGHEQVLDTSYEVKSGVSDLLGNPPEGDDDLYS